MGSGTYIVPLVKILVLGRYGMKELMYWKKIWVRK